MSPIPRCFTIAPRFAFNLMQILSGVADTVAVVVHVPVTFIIACMPADLMNSCNRIHAHISQGLCALCPACVFTLMCLYLAAFGSSIQAPACFVHSFVGTSKSVGVRHQQQQEDCD